MGRHMLSIWGLGLLLASLAMATESTEETKEEVKWSAFEHVGEADFKKTLQEREYNLVACEFSSEAITHSKRQRLTVNQSLA